MCRYLGVDVHILRDGKISVILWIMWLFEGLNGSFLDVIKHLSIYKKSKYDNFSRLIPVNFKDYIKISFQLLSSNSKKA